MPTTHVVSLWAGAVSSIPLALQLYLVFAIPLEPLKFL